MTKIWTSLTLAMALGMCATSMFDQAFGKPAKKPQGRAGGVREKHISREQTVKSRDQTNLDFEAADIGGARKAPMGSFLNNSKSDKEYDFVKIRLRWVPEMVQSSSSLDTGKGR